jgi:hypothetical protein
MVLGMNACSFAASQRLRLGNPGFNITLLQAKVFPLACCQNIANHTNVWLCALCSAQLFHLYVQSPLHHKGGGVDAIADHHINRIGRAGEQQQIHFG